MKLHNWQGSKSSIASKILPYFPEHSIYIEPFFGTGGMFFAKPQVQYNILNDLNNDIYNLYTIMTNHKKRGQLYKLLKLIPHHNAIFKQEPKNDIEKAGLFLCRFNYSFLGAGNTQRLEVGNSKKILLSKVKNFIELENVIFSNLDAIKFVNSLIIRGESESKRMFIYNDPPYINTSNCYSLPTWTLTNLEDLIIVSKSKNCKFAISEFDTPEVVELANKYNLNSIVIGERRNLQKRRKELLFTNYQLTNTSVTKKSLF